MRFGTGMTMVLASTTSLAPPRLTSNDADRWRALAAVASPDNRKISIDLAACDAALVSAARESEARYGVDSQEAKISYALLEECRQRDARHTPDEREAYPVSEREADLELLARMSSSREYVAWLRTYRSARRRVSAANVIDDGVSPIPLENLAAPWASRAAHPDAAARDAAVAEAQASGAPWAWDIAEEVLASDNSIASAPSLEDDDGQPEDIALSVELALEYIEQLSWRAEETGAFGHLRAAV